MKWKENKINVNGDVRHRKCFLFLPKKIGNETRWLEVSRFTQRFIHEQTIIGLMDGWVNECWEHFKGEL